MCTRPNILPRPGIPEHRWSAYKQIRPKTDFLIVPCGKCVECLKRRQKDIAARCVIEANARGSMVFLTLTYNEEHLPMSVVFEVVDKSTGEITDRSYSDCVISGRKKKDLPKLAELQATVKGMELSPFPRYGTKVLYEDDKVVYQYSLTPSLCRKDVRLWLKSSRMAYKREFGEALDFSYICAGEYGPNTCRPHYHLALFGLTVKQARFLAERWRVKHRKKGDIDNYGNYDLKEVCAVNPDSTSGFERASKYIAKYVAKGFFECRSVVDCRAERPRMSCSIRGKCGLGDSFLSPSLVEHFRCTDLFPGLDIMKVDSVSDIQLLAREVQKRSLVSYGDFTFPLPRKFILKLWFVYDDFTKSYVASPLRVAMQDFIQIDLFRDYCHKFADSSPGLFGADSLLFGSDSVDNSFLSSDEAKGVRQFANCYKQSMY